MKHGKKQPLKIWNQVLTSRSKFLTHLFKKINLIVEKEINNFNRQALHAKSLGFIHPTTKREVFFETKRPEDFDRLIKTLNKASI